MKTVIEQIEDIVIFYNGITKDFQDIERLQSGVRKLATLLFMFAGEVGLLYKERNGTEFSRRAATERKKCEAGQVPPGQMPLQRNLRLIYSKKNNRQTLAINRHVYCTNQQETYSKQ